MNVTINLLSLWLIIVLKCVSGQVNRSSEKLQKEFFMKHQNINNMDWYQPHNMSNFARIMVCVDVWQKIDNKRIMGGKYKPTTGAHIPILQVHTKRLKNVFDNRTIIITKDNIIHCALNSIEFEKNSFLRSPTFYVTDSIREYCLYLLSVEKPFLIIKAEVCGVLVDIKYNTLELETEYANAMKDPAEGLNQIIWDEIIRMNNENRFTLCMDIYERITRTHFPTGIAKNKHPMCSSISASLFLESSRQNGSAQYVMVLHCPLNEIHELKTKLPKTWTRIPPIYLAKSIHSGCVYLLGETENTDPNRAEDEPELSVFIKAEICGALGSVKDNVYQLEQQFSKGKDYLIESDDMASQLTLTHTHKVQFCIQIYRIHHQESLENCRLDSQVPQVLGIIEFKMIKSQNKVVSSVYCPMREICSDAKVDSFYVADSVNLGCLYVLSPTVERNLIQKLHIEKEICGMYPFELLLHIKPDRINDAILK